MKRALTFLLILMVLLPYFCTPVFAASVDTADRAPNILMRAGGGGSGGSGGSGGGGGSSGGSSRHHHSSGSDSSGSSGSLLAHFIAPILILSSSVAFSIKLSKRSRKSKRLMKQLMESDNAWKYKDICATIENSFFIIQTAWREMDMTPAAEYMSGDLFQNFQTKLNWMAFKNQKNILENIRLVKALPVAVYDDIDNSRDFIWFFIKGKMVDYTIDTETQQKTDGSTHPTAFVEYWKYIRRDNRWVLDQILQKDETDKIPFND